jgi:parallel beta-helix repeat protein
MISSTAGGYVSVPGEGVFLFPHGDIVSIEATAVDANFYFVNWSGSAVDADKVADPNSANTTVMMDEDCTLKAHFATILTTVYVGASDPNDPNEYGTAEHPLSSIQDAIDVAQGETEIVVSAGVYEGGLVLGDKDIQLIAQEPNDPNEDTHSIIVGDVNEPTISFSGAQDANCALSGFTVTGGMDGIVCDGISPVITNCVVTGNKGYGIACYDSNATIVNCTVTGNGAGSSGGGLSSWDSNVTLINCILWNNFPESITVWSGADPLVSYSDIEGTWPGEGNIDIDPCFADPGYWADANDTNIIVEPNDANAVWVDDDYHLISEEGRWDPSLADWVLDLFTSPCIDAGDPNSPVGEEPFPNGGIINMGAYGGTLQASMSLSTPPL